MTEIALEISRFNPETDEFPYFQRFMNVEYSDTDTVLDILLKVKQTIEPALTFRYSCACTICGSCAMTINDKARFACESKINDVQIDGFLKIEPLPFFTVIKDLVVDIEPLVENLKLILPWMVRDHSKPLPEKEYIIKPGEINKTLEMMDRCNLCGVCNSYFETSEKERPVVGLASVVKTLKFLLDPRDSVDDFRLIQLIELGLLRYPNKIKIECPKGIDLSNDVICFLKDRAINKGLL